LVPPAGLCHLNALRPSSVPRDPSPLPGSDSSSRPRPEPLLGRGHIGSRGRVVAASLGPGLGLGAPLGIASKRFRRFARVVLMTPLPSIRQLTVDYYRSPRFAGFFLFDECEHWSYFQSIHHHREDHPKDPEHFPILFHSSHAVFIELLSRFHSAMVCD